MEEKLSFDTNVSNYDKCRPKYSKELFEDIISYANISGKSELMEIGAGTGIATAPFLRTGAHITAIEPGKNMAVYLTDKFRTYSNMTIENTMFEDYNCENNKYDLLYSATAFHWIPPQVGYTKAHSILRPGGTLALFWNRPFPSQNDRELDREIQAVYRKYRPSGKKPPEDKTPIYNKIKETISDFGFKNVKCRLYYGQRVFFSEEYINLLNTYSDHIVLDPVVKRCMEKEIARAIRKYGDKITIDDTIDLYLATK